VRAADFHRFAVTAKSAIIPSGSYWTVLPTSECEIEVPGIGLSSRRSLPPPPQAVNPRIATAIASAPAVTLRDLELVCILFFLSGVLDIARSFSARLLAVLYIEPVLLIFGSRSFIGDAAERDSAKLRADRVERDLVVRAADFRRRADAFDRQRVVETGSIQRFGIGAGRS
jgi:hypothetical protein